MFISAIHPFIQIEICKELTSVAKEPKDGVIIVRLNPSYSSCSQMIPLLCYVIQTIDVHILVLCCNLHDGNILYSQVYNSNIIRAVFLFF